MTRFQLGDIGQCRPVPAEAPKSRYACRCGQPARPKPRGERGGHPKLCHGCQRESLRRSWRETKRRRAEKYGVAGLKGGGGIPTGGSSMPRHPLARRRASRWRWEQFNRGSAA